METIRVDWCRLNQKQFRAETENGLEEYVAAQEAGSRVLAIFLASFCLVLLFASARLAPMLHPPSQNDTARIIFRESAEHV